MIDLLFLSYNRLAFTRESFEALLANTNWDLVGRLILYDDGSTDGTREYLFQRALSIRVETEFRDRRLGSPVATMNEYLSGPGADVFGKIDSDTVVPPGWLDACMDVMRRSPELGLLGIEPAGSRKRAPWSRGTQPPPDPRELMPGRNRWIPCDSIGGIGLMRRAAFASGDTMRPHSIYGGFTDWQLRNKRVLRGWIAPALKVFLLDRMPHDPWRSLSVEYMAKGWQRPWTNYTEADRDLWEWWTPVWQEEKLCA